MTETIGFIGLGNMGEPMAANLLNAGYKVRIYNRTAAKAASLVQKGAELVASPAEVGVKGGIVLTMLADDHAVEEICTGSPSFLDELGSGGIHISCSTVLPATARKMGEFHAERGIHYLGTPVFGRPEAAAAKKLWVCVSGNAAAKKRAEPVLAAIGQATFDFGTDPGGANVVKLCGNFLIASAIESLGEALTLAEKNGLSPADVADLFGKTLFSCPVYQGYGKIIAAKKYEPAAFRLVLGLKDVNHVLETAEESAVPMPIASLLHDRLLSEVAKGHGDRDWSSMAAGMAESAGLK
jgi:3-hydroxyisobutyrate dehydrogenase-like beta-hydroxyacid dehydrogenase